MSAEQMEKFKSQIEIFYNLYFPSNKIYCDFCEKDITKMARIQCAECKNFDICGICFSKGLESDPHISSHNYHIIGKKNFPLLDFG